MNTEAVIASAPAGVTVDVYDPSQLTTELPEGYDRLILGATEKLRPETAEALAGTRFLVWTQSAQPPHMVRLFREAVAVAWPSDVCAEWHRWNGRYHVFPGAMNPDEVPVGPKEDFALWAGRDHPQKGRMNARLWAWQAGLKLVELDNATRSEVLETMSRARYFVHLPKGTVDPCPRTVIEAELAGCQLIVNDLVGRAPATDRALADYLRGAPHSFWVWVAENP